MGVSGDMFEPLDRLMKLMAWCLLFSVPLGLWKAVEIVIWLIRHVNISG